jgi:hypothetical protein
MVRRKYGRRLVSVPKNKRDDVNKALEAIGWGANCLSIAIGSKGNGNITHYGMMLQVDEIDAAALVKAGVKLADIVDPGAGRGALKRALDSKNLDTKGLGK